MAYFQTPMDLWSVRSAPGAAAQPSASKAAGGAGVRHVAKRVIITLATNDTVQTPIAVNLRDGATGAGTILVTWQVAQNFATGLGATKNGLVVIDADNLDLVGTSNTAMTLEFAAATQANVTGSCELIGYDFGVKPVAVPVYVS